jgi:hypothetical protein
VLGAVDRCVHTKKTGAGFRPVHIGTGERALWYFIEAPEVDLAAHAVEATAVPADDGYELVVRARSLAQDVMVLADDAHPEARVDNG